MKREIPKIASTQLRRRLRQTVRRFSRTAWMLVCLFVSTLAPPSFAQLIPGHVLVIDYEAGTSAAGALFSVDPSNGVRTVISDFGNSLQGPLGVNPKGVAIEPSGSVLAIDENAGTNNRGALFRVDPSTGLRTLLSDFGNPSQGTVFPATGSPLPLGPRDVAVEASGSILVSDHQAGTNFHGALFRIDPANGIRTIVSDFGVGTPLGENPLGFAIEASGNILVIDFDGGTNDAGQLFRVDASDGSRTLVSDFGSASPTGVAPINIAIDASGNALVTDFQGGTSALGALFTVDTTTGVRALLSDFGNAAQGTTGVNPVGVLPITSENVLVVDDAAGSSAKGALFSVSVADGSRTVISNFGNQAEGEQGAQPSRLALVPIAPGTSTCNGQLETSGCTVNGVANQSCVGTPGDDTIAGTTGADVILGLEGNDTITGAAGGDLICGGDGNDTLMGSLGPDQLFGEAGDDTLKGGRGGDAVDGGDGTDTCAGGLGSRDGAANCEAVTGVP